MARIDLVSIVVGCRLHPFSVWFDLVKLNSGTLVEPDWRETALQPDFFRELFVVISLVLSWLWYKQFTAHKESERERVGVKLH